MAKDTKSAGASYIIRFYDDVANLTHYYSLYQSALLEIEARIPDYKEDSKLLAQMDENSKNNFIGILQNLRHHINTSYISFISLNDELGIKKTKNNDLVKKTYQEIKKKYIIEEKAAFELVQQLNHFLLNNILSDLLKQSEDLVNDIYGKSNNTD